MWILTDLLSLLLIVIIFIFHWWITHAQSKTEPFSRKMHAVCRCGSDPSRQLDLCETGVTCCVLWQVERARTGFLLGQQDHAGQQHLQQVQNRWAAVRKCDERLPTCQFFFMGIYVLIILGLLKIGRTEKINNWDLEALFPAVYCLLTN